MSHSRPSSYAVCAHCSRQNVIDHDKGDHVDENEKYNGAAEKDTRLRLAFFLQGFCSFICSLRNKCSDTWK